LSLMENGKRIPTLAAVVSLARLYGTTADFLCGFAAGLDRDPAVSAELLIASKVSCEVRRLISTMVAVSHGAVRELRPDAGKVLRLAGVALEVAAILERVRRNHPEFDDLRCGATLVARVEVGASIAREVVEQNERARQTLRQAPVDLGFAVDGLHGAGDDAPAAAFWPPRQVAPGALDPDEPLDLEDDAWAGRAS
jgi:hypothetical protein